MKKVSIGVTSVIGWVTGAVALLPLLVKDLEAGKAALGSGEKYAAIAGVVALAITQIGRYAQSLKL